jgi:hypothetical protein
MQRELLGARRYPIAPHGELYACSDPEAVPQRRLHGMQIEQ